jgi:ubiquinone/menaquinone biosynthesis C-methylase UbiE
MNSDMRTKKGYGDFGTLSRSYDAARKGFPEESIDYIFEKTGKEKPDILDIGCGTGIATEQLVEKGAHTIGTDVDTDMIRQAQKDNRYDIEYNVAPAEKLPFPDATFDAVTAFSAFHWFANRGALNEIKRVLKPSGYFFTINKNEAGDFKKENKKILQQFMEKELPDVKKHYDPNSVLAENGFSDIEEKIFNVTEYFTPEEALSYIQTMSVWNLVLENKRRDVLSELLKRFNMATKKGKVERKLEIVVVSGGCFE